MELDKIVRPFNEPKVVTLYIMVGDLGVVWRQGSVRGYAIDELELIVAVGSSSKERSLDYIKANLDDLIKDEALSYAARTYGVGFSKFSVQSIWLTHDEDRDHPIPQDWKYSRHWQS